MCNKLKIHNSNIIIIGFSGKCGVGKTTTSKQMFGILNGELQLKSFAKPLKKCAYEYFG